MHWSPRVRDVSCLRRQLGRSQSAQVALRLLHGRITTRALRIFQTRPHANVEDLLDHLAQINAEAAAAIRATLQAASANDRFHSSNWEE